MSAVLNWPAKMTSAPDPERQMSKDERGDTSRPAAVQFSATASRFAVSAVFYASLTARLRLAAPKENVAVLF